MSATDIAVADPDQYEPDNDFSQAKSITTNGTVQTHTIHLPGDEDWVKFEAQTGYQYVIETLNLQGGADTYIGLFWDDNNDNHADLIVADDNSAGNLASRITWTSSRTGTHYVKVRDTVATKGGTSVSYGLKVTATAPVVDQYEPDNDFSQAKSITTNGTVQTHTIHLPGDEDWVKFEAQTGYQYVIETLNLQGGADTYIGLFWDDNNDNHADLIVADDNSAGNLASRITWTSPRTGTHYVKVRDTVSTKGGTSVSYGLKVTATAPVVDQYEPDNDFSQAKSIATNGTTQTHTIHIPGDEDWVKFEAQTGYQYVIETLNLQGGADTYIGLFWDDNNDNHVDLIMADDNSAGNLASRITWTSPRTGTHYVKVRDTVDTKGGQNVAYGLKVTATAPVGDQYEPDNDFSQAKSITTNGTVQTHTIHLPSDEDWVKFEAQTGYQYVIETLNLQGGADTYIGLFWDDNNDNHADLIMADDNSAGNLASRITWTSPRTGIHYVKVRDTVDTKGGQNVAYGLKVTATAPVGDQYEPDNDFSQAKSVATNGTVQTHTIHLPKDEDWVKFEAQTGYQYVIETLNLQGGADTYIGLFWDDNNDNHVDLIMADDNSAGNLASRITWTSPRTGTHYVKVRDTVDTKGGQNVAYSLRVTESEPEPPRGTQVLRNASFDAAENPRVDNHWQWIKQDAAADCFAWTYGVNDAAGPPEDGDRFLVTHRNNAENCVSFAQDVRHFPQVGDEYTFTLSARAPVSGVVRNFDMQIHVQDAAGKLIQSSERRSFSVDQNQWQSFSTDLVITAADAVTVRAEVYLMNVDNLNYNFDNARLVGPERYSISGQVTAGGQPLAGVTVSASIGGRVAETISKNDGSYTLVSLPNGNYGLTPSDDHSSLFKPGTRYVTVDGASVQGIDFTAIERYLLSQILRDGSFEDSADPNLAWDWQGDCFRTSVDSSATSIPAYHGVRFLSTHRKGNTNCSSFFQDVMRYPRSGETYIFEIAAKAPTNLPQHNRHFDMQLFAIGDNGSQQVGERVAFTAVSTAWTRHSVSMTVNSGSYHTLRAEIYLLDVDQDEIQYHFDDAQLLGPKAYTIAGRVRAGANTPVSGATIAVKSGNLHRSVQTNTNGTYRISYIPAGTYTFEATKEGVTFIDSPREETVADHRWSVDFHSEAPVSAGLSTIRLSSTSAPADAKTPIIMTVELRNSAGEPVAEHGILIESDGINTFVKQNQDRTNSDGTFEAEIRARKPTRSTLTVYDWTDRVRIGEVEVEFTDAPTAPGQELISAVDTLYSHTSSSISSIATLYEQATDHTEYFADKVNEDVANLMSSVIFSAISAVENQSQLSQGSTYIKDYMPQEKGWRKNVASYLSRHKSVDGLYQFFYRLADSATPSEVGKLITREAFWNIAIGVGGDQAGGVVDEIAEKTLALVLKSLFAEPALVTESTLEDLSAMRSTIFQQKQHLDKEMPSLPIELQKRYVDDFLARAALTNLAHTSYSHMESTLHNLRSAHAQGAGEVESFLLKQSAKNFAKALGPIATFATDTSIAAIDIGFNMKKLDTSMRGLQYGVTAMAVGPQKVKELFANSSVALDNLIQEIPDISSVPTASIESVRHTVEGDFFVKKSYSDVTIRNASETDAATFTVVALYEHTNDFPVIGLPYARIHDVSEVSEYLEPRESKIVRVYYKNDNTGFSPDAESRIRFYLVAFNRFGYFMVDFMDTTWSVGTVQNRSNERLATSSISDAIPLQDSPVSTYVLNGATEGTYQLRMWIENPFNEPIRLAVKQAIPQGVTLLTTDGVSYTEEIVWYPEIDARNLLSTTAVFIFNGEPGEQVIIEPAELTFAKPGTSDPITILSNELAVQVPYPAEISSSVEFGASGNILLTVYATNQTANPVKPSVRVNIGDSQSRIVHEESHSFDLGSFDEKSWTTTLPILPPDIYAIYIYQLSPTAELLIGTSHFIIETPDTDLDNIYLPMILHQ